MQKLRGKVIRVADIEGVSSVGFLRFSRRRLVQHRLPFVASLNFGEKISQFVILVSRKHDSREP
jgi:hypothetical protein